jgi:hypothetical protein
MIPMLRLRRSPPLIALLAGVVFATSPPRAHADFELQIYEGSTLVQTVTSTPSSPNSLSFNLSDSNFRYSGVLAFTNNPGTFLNSNMQISTLTVTNLGVSQQTISFVLSANNFTMPVNPLDTMSSTISSSSTLSLGNTDSLTFQSYVDANNNLFGETSTTGLQSLDVASGTLTSGATNTVQGVVNKGGGSYSLTDVTTLTLSAGAQIGATGATTLSSSSATVAAPSPGGLTLACLGIPLLVLGSRWRRRQPQLN